MSEPQLDRATVAAGNNSWTLLPPPAGTCPQCAVDHPAEQPHNQQSLFYQYHFYFAQGRWPTWKDAMAHCDEPTRATWTAELTKRGAVIE